VTFSGSARAGVTSTLSPASATIPAHGSVQVSATLTNASVSTGSGAFTLTATDAAAHEETTRFSSGLENFGAPVSVGSVSMTPRPGYGPTGYTIQVSSDGQNWTTMATVSAAASGTTTTTVTPVTAQYLRLVMTGSYQASGETDQIAELDVAGP
jgi:hypothetical protein